MYPVYPQVPTQGYAMPNRPQPRCTQPVTPEMSKMIFAQEDDLSVKISPIDKAKNMCTHKYPGGQIALVEVDEAVPIAPNIKKVYCKVCGESFHLYDDIENEVITATEKIYDILQSIKTVYLDIPESFAKEYFQMISLVNRIPALYKKAQNNYKSYDQWNGSPSAVYGMTNSFNTINGMIGGYNMGGFGQAPAYGYPPQQPAGYGYPQQPAAPAYTPAGVPNGPQAYAPAQPQAPQVMYDQWGNPIYYPPQPQPPQAGENPFMGTAPAAPQAPVAPPAAPAPAPAAGIAPADGEVVQTKAFSV